MRSTRLNSIHYEHYTNSVNWSSVLVCGLPTGNCWKRLRMYTTVYHPMSAVKVVTLFGFVQSLLQGTSYCCFPSDFGYPYHS